jgi:SAM-dependent methyltransferase
MLEQVRPAFQRSDAAFCAVLVASPGGERLVAELLADLCSDVDVKRRLSALVWQVEPGEVNDVCFEDTLRSTGLVLRHLEDDAALQQNSVYFVPAHCRVWFEGQELRVASRAPGEAHPIDRLFFSLAEGWGEHCMSVLAAAVEDDGESGLRAVRAAGGLALQRLGPGEPSPDGSARERRGAWDAVAPDMSAGDRFARGRVLASASLAALRAAAEAAVWRAEPRGRLRAWVPGCKTGGTAYVAAMLLSEAASGLPEPPRMLIFGTDEDEAALAVARRGSYPVHAALGLDPALRGGYTFDEGETIRVSETLRERCVFSRHELLRDLPMARMDLVVCHKVFDGVPSASHARLVDAFHWALRDGGLLLALDHVELFPEERFERVEGGFLRARRHRASALIGVHTAVRWSAPDPEADGEETTGRFARVGSGRRARVLQPTAEPFTRAIGLPLLICDRDLRVTFLSGDAFDAFGPFEGHGSAGCGAPRRPHQRDPGDLDPDGRALLPGPNLGLGQRRRGELRHHLQ